MTTIQDYIVTFTNMIIKGFGVDKITLDYTLTSFKEIDKFFDLNSKNGQVIKGGRFSKDLGQILFALGAYMGQTIIKLVPGTVWQIDETDSEGEINASLKLPDGALVWPMQRSIKRFRNGEEDGIYAYGYHIVQNYIDIESLLKKELANRKRSLRWKFW